jgi:hypothetical protein
MQQFCAHLLFTACCCLTVQPLACPQDNYGVHFINDKADIARKADKKGDTRSPF